MKVISRIITGVVIAAAVAALGICSYMGTPLALLIIIFI